MKTKQDEIKAIRALIDMDGYFADAFKGDTEKMESNILNDFPLLYNTKVNEKPEKLEENIRQCNTKIRFLCEHLLRLKNGVDGSVIEDAVLDALGHETTIRLKLKLDIPVSPVDVFYLLQKLEETRNTQSTNLE